MVELTDAEKIQKIRDAVKWHDHALIDARDANASERLHTRLMDQLDRILGDAALLPLEESDVSVQNSAWSAHLSTKSSSRQARRSSFDAGWDAARALYQK